MAFRLPPPPVDTTTSGPRRGICIDKYTRMANGVWYYQIDIELHDAVDSQYYSVLRRYSDFEQLHGQLLQLCSSSSEALHAPPFPVKELLSPALLGFLWRVTSSMQVLEERRQAFGDLLQWVEQHELLKTSGAYIEFLGQPPQLQNGYVSLKSYTSPNWLSSLQHVSRGKEKRQRRHSMDCPSTSPAVSASRSFAVTMLEPAIVESPPLSSSSSLPCSPVESTRALFSKEQEPDHSIDAPLTPRRSLKRKRCRAMEPDCHPAQDKIQRHAKPWKLKPRRTVAQEEGDNQSPQRKIQRVHQCSQLLRVGLGWVL